MKVHTFRIDYVTHCQWTRRSELRRNGRHRTFCGVVIDHDAQRLAPHADSAKEPMIDCPTCAAVLAGLLDIFEKPGPFADRLVDVNQFNRTTKGTSIV